ncbi:hypothetical protein BT69DRAFT_1352928 [Atractiella rhizophila]|nr:hypothetical protein BT69DRAFT_1352928 [Atractiella rhizophila]
MMAVNSRKEVLSAYLLGFDDYRLNCLGERGMAWSHPPTVVTGDLWKKPRAGTKSRSTGCNKFCLRNLC